MEPPKEKSPDEEPKGVDPEKAKKMVKCYDYMTNLKSLLTKEEYSQYLVFLKLLKDNYLKDKVLFYATVAFQIFFPTDMKAVLDNYDVRKSLFSQSKFFFPKTDRETYSAACAELMKRMDENVNSFIKLQEAKQQKAAKKPAVKLQPPVYLEYQKKHAEDENPEKAALLAKMQSTAQAAKKPIVRAVSDKETICMICFEPFDKSRDFARSKCGHTACWACWAQWLENCLECPMCKQRTRLKQLVKIT